jgi:hypothetical protein
LSNVVLLNYRPLLRNWSRSAANHIASLTPLANNLRVRHVSADNCASLSLRGSLRATTTPTSRPRHSYC